VSREPVEIEAEEHEQIVERVAAIDVAKASGQVCTRVPHVSIPGRRVTKVWNVEATTNAITALAEQLAGEGIGRVVVESTSDYWRPFVYLLQARGVTVWLVNAREVKQVPGRPKTDTLDTVWLAKLNERGARPHRHAGGTPDGRLTGRNLTRSIFGSETGQGLPWVSRTACTRCFQAGTVADEVQPPARPLPLCAHEWVGQPDRRHQVTTRELGQHPGVDAVGLAGERREPLHLLRVCDLDLPAGELEPIVHEPCPVHRLDRRPNRSAMTLETLTQAVQAISIRRRCPDLDRRTVDVEEMKVETLATEIQTGVQHRSGPPLR